MWSRKRGWSNRIQDLAFRHMPCGCCAFESEDYFALYVDTCKPSCTGPPNNLFDLAESVEEKLERIFFVIRSYAGFVHHNSTPRDTKQERIESRTFLGPYIPKLTTRNRPKSRLDCMCIDATPDQSRGSRFEDPGYIFWAELCHADAGIAECCSSGETSPRTQQRGLSG